MYCIYTDREVAEPDGNWDHVIPLSLGGANDFTVWSDEKYNSRIGSTVDGAINKDFFIGPALAASGVRGHSRKVAAPRVRRASIDGRPAQVNLTDKGFKIWDARARRELTDEETSGSEISLRITVRAFTALRFIAKVALGGGYAIYGEPFRRVVDCDALRRVIDMEVEAARSDPVLRNSGFFVCDRWHPDSRAGGPGHLDRVACEQLNRSVLMCQVYKNGIAFHVGVVGEFIGTLFCPGDTAELPNEGDHEGGHVVVLAPGGSERLAYDGVLRELQAAITEMNPAEPDTDPVSEDADP